MTKLIATGGFIKYETVSEAMKVANIDYQEDNPKGVLVWFDNVQDKDFFSNLLPYQIVNRIPSINMICRKAPFVGLIQRIIPIFPEYFTFLPLSFILPLKNQQFIAAVNKAKSRFIVKPDGGSLGKGITIVEPGQHYETQTHLAIAQEYIESRLIHNTKFDMRIYALVASVQPEIKIYVYREGIARFCSAEYDEHSLFSQITNTAVNRQNPEANMQNITQRVSKVFEELEHPGAYDKYFNPIRSSSSTNEMAQNSKTDATLNTDEIHNDESQIQSNLHEQDDVGTTISCDNQPNRSEQPNIAQDEKQAGADINAVWRKIDRAIVFTIMSACNYVIKEVHSSCPCYGLPRCFQILGFDVLLDKDLNPFILEVNFRPSLEFDTEDEKQLKIEMLSQAMKIAAPYQDFQPYISDRTTPWNDKMWVSFLHHNPDLVKRVERNRDLAVKNSKFVKVFPTKGPDNNDYLRVYNSVRKLPAKMGINYNIPDMKDIPKPRIMNSQLKPIITKPLQRRSKSPSRKPSQLYPL